MNFDNFTPEEAPELVAFNDIVAKLKAIGWVEKSVTGLGGKYKDVRITATGTGGLLNVHALERALGGLTDLQAAMLFKIARKLANDKPDSN